MPDIAYTYTEPTVFFEFARDTARLAAARGLRNVFVTNGYMTPEALDEIHPHLHAANVDLKSYSDDFYRTYCGACLAGVTETLQQMRERGILVEVTTLVIPGLNDSARELKALAAFLVETLGPQTPWHVSRFHPTYRLTDRGPTPVATLLAAREIGLAAGLSHVYIGNVPGQGGEDTLCPGCGRTVIARCGFQVGAVRMAGGRCDTCGTAITESGISRKGCCGVFKPPSIHQPRFAQIPDRSGVKLGREPLAHPLAGQVGIGRVHRFQDLQVLKNLLNQV